MQELGVMLAVLAGLDPEKYVRDETRALIYKTKGMEYPCNVRVTES
jgi:hypothetical protein